MSGVIHMKILHYHKTIHFSLRSKEDLNKKNKAKSVDKKIDL
jgi:hypothetical protein